MNDLAGCSLDGLVAVALAIFDSFQLKQADQARQVSIIDAACAVLERVEHYKSHNIRINRPEPDLLLWTARQIESRT